MGRRRTKSPEQQAAELHEKVRRKREIDRLEAQGVDVVADQAHRIIRAQRLDVFALLHSRGQLNQGELNAVRRLEEDMAVAGGHLRPEQSYDRVDRSTDGAPGQNVTQTMIDASGAVKEVLAMCGPIHGALLSALVEGGSLITRWRATVRRVTGEESDRAGALLVRQAARTLEQVYHERDFGRRAA